MSNRKVIYAKLQGTSHVAGIGEIPSTLPPTGKHIPGLAMHREEGTGDLLVTSNVADFVIPSANCQLMVLEKLPPSAVKK